MSKLCGENHLFGSGSLEPGKLGGPVSVLAMAWAGLHNLELPVDLAVCRGSYCHSDCSRGGCQPRRQQAEYPARAIDVEPQRVAKQFAVVE